MSYVGYVLDMSRRRPTPEEVELRLRRARVERQIQEALGAYARFKRWLKEQQTSAGRRRRTRP